MNRRRAVVLSAVLIFIPLISSAANLAGTWSGPYTLDGVSGELRITVGQVGTMVLARAESQAFSSAPVVGVIEAFFGACAWDVKERVATAVAIRAICRCLCIPGKVLADAKTRLPYLPGT